MKGILRAILFLLITTSAAYAQRGRPPIDRIHAAKMAYITDRLHLSAQQSGSFIPMYNDYERELRDIRQYYFKKYRGGSSARPMNDATPHQYIDDDLDYQQQVIALKRKYNDQFLRVISPDQLTELHRAEREFKQLLMQRLHQRRDMMGR